MIPLLDTGVNQTTGTGTLGPLFVKSLTRPLSAHQDRLDNLRSNLHELAFVFMTLVSCLL